MHNFLIVEVLLGIMMSIAGYVGEYLTKLNKYYKISTMILFWIITIFIMFMNIALEKDFKIPLKQYTIGYAVLIITIYVGLFIQRLILK